MNKRHEINWTTEQVSRLWGYYADNPSYASQYFSNHSGQSIVNYIKNHVSIYDKTILDFGCGPGFLLDKLIKSGASKVYGLDFSRQSVDKANAAHQDKKTFKGAVCLDNLPSLFKDNTFDVVVAVEVVEHLSEDYLLEMLKEVHRILKPGGFFIVTTPNQENLESNKTICPDCGCVFHRWQHLRTWNVTLLKEYMESQSFLTRHIASTIFGRFPIRFLYHLRHFFKKGFSYPHLIYIGKK
ncbi:MAG: class I SAM-dependent methyltransferase [Candidatus Omnitrophica bacterium]|nr:class I SAM-dependent methyltransferase [Candidatus Omnitrophota bacterium]